MINLWISSEKARCSFGPIHSGVPCWEVFDRRGMPVDATIHLKYLKIPFQIVYKLAVTDCLIQNIMYFSLTNEVSQIIIFSSSSDMKDHIGWKRSSAPRRPRWQLRILRLWSMRGAGRLKRTGRKQGKTPGWSWLSGKIVHKYLLYKLPFVWENPWTSI